MLTAIVFLSGLLLGSFLNVVILRLGTSEPIIISRSKCPHCGKILSWYELIPVIRFLAQKGRCRSCGSGLSFQYPLVEILTGFVLVGFILYAENPIFVINKFSESINLFLNAVFYVSIAGLLIAIFFYDFKNKIIPDSLVFPLIALSFAPTALSLFYGRPAAWDLISAAAIAVFFAFLWAVSGGNWMGLGDAKLILATSLLARFPRSISALLFAFWLGALFAIILLLSGRAGFKSKIPFGPFIILGFLASLFLEIPFLGL